jgi:hypothetical protein
VTLESSVHPIGAIEVLVAVAIGAAVQHPVLAVDLRVPGQHTNLGVFPSPSLGHDPGRCPLAFPAVAVPRWMATSKSGAKTDFFRLLLSRGYDGCTTLGQKLVICQPRMSAFSRTQAVLTVTSTVLPRTADFQWFPDAVETNTLCYDISRTTLAQIITIKADAESKRLTH